MAKDRTLRAVRGILKSPPCCQTNKYSIREVFWPHTTERGGLPTICQSPLFSMQLSSDSGVGWQLPKSEMYCLFGFCLCLASVAETTRQLRRSDVLTNCFELFHFFYKACFAFFWCVWKAEVRNEPEIWVLLDIMTSHGTMRNGCFSEWSL